MELGEYSKELHREIGKEILNTNIQNVFLYGNDVKEIYQILNGKRNVKLFENKNEISDEILKLSDGTQTFIWVKGSRSMKMEEVVKNLLEG